MNERNFQNSDGTAFDSDEIGDMFDSIAGRYDFMNKILSLGRDKHWRKKTAQCLQKSSPKKILDLATGTADLLISCLKYNRTISNAVGIDISAKMLEIAEKKLKNKYLDSRSNLIYANATELPFEAESFDAVVAGFGVRNFSDLPVAVSQVWRVLRPGGKFVIIEFSMPKNLFRPVFKFYMKMAPFIAKLLKTDQNAYKYLANSIELFGFPEKFVKVLKTSGFGDIRVKKMNFGSICICIGSKCEKKTRNNKEN
ncbi:MAG: bifunctional demethylmenaquinone methyltransferase/2-methoxy-6-polyprenyl-1,4-benzoquinol methylase UbiE [Anaerohalosphaeraceae bacterium]|nr:bifunctional demethylmenaquinone methyltransferase/2-methoxy-6-polyprenyl-1,4-benzoquinol methylase UbiE [Anaerohalosphaeraceae bacterium]